MRRLINIAACALALALTAAAQGPQVYTNDSVDYALELPNATWRTVARGDSINNQVEFIYQDRSDALLRIRKEIVGEGVKLSDLADRERDTKLRMRYQNGFIEGKTENFAGRLSGVAENFEYTQGGKPMVGRIYYLQADPRTVYVLHFTGRRETLRQLRAQTDSIARSFKIK